MLDIDQPAKPLIFSPFKIRSHSENFYNLVKVLSLRQFLALSVIQQDMWQCRHNFLVMAN